MHTLLRTYIYCLLVVPLLFVSRETFATHNAGAQITYKCLGGDTYLLRYTYYYDCDGTAGIPSTNVTNGLNNSLTFNETQNLNNTNGTRIWNSCNGTTITPQWVLKSRTEISNTCPASLTSCDPGTIAQKAARPQGREEVIYEDTIVLPAQCNFWTIGVGIFARSTQIENSNAQNGRLWVETTIYNTNRRCNNSPVFTGSPAATVYTGQTVNYLMGAIDPDGDSIDVRVINPKRSNNVNFNYNNTYSISSPFKSFVFDFKTGDFSFKEAVNDTGKFVIAVQVSEYEKGTGLQLSTVIRDIQISLVDDTNRVPQLAPGGVGNKFCSISGGSVKSSDTLKTKRGASLSFEIPFIDMDTVNTSSTTWEFTDSLNITSNASTALTGSTTQQFGNKTTVSGSDTVPVRMRVNWTVPVTAIGPYAVSFEVRDNSCPYNALFFKGVTIEIVDTITSVTLTPKNEKCAGDGQGTITATVNGGIGPFSYEWFRGATSLGVSTSNVLTNVTPGINHFVIVRDSFNVSLIDTDTSGVASVSSPTQMFVQGTNSTQNIGCEGGCTGLATVGTVVNGTPYQGASPGPSNLGYRFSWSSVSDTTTTADSLCSGIQTVTISDASGCTLVQSFDIKSESPNVTVTVVDSSDVNCKGGNDGSATARGVINSCGVYSNLLTAGCSITDSITISTGINVGDYPSSSLPSSPLGLSRNSRHQYLYTASELKAAGFVKGRISKVSWESAFNFFSAIDVTIKIGCTDSTDLDSGFVGGLHTVFSGTANLPSGAFLGIPLQKIFEWDGQSNLVVETCNSRLGTTTFNFPIKRSETPFNSTAFVDDLTKSVCDTDYYQVSKVRPNIKLFFCDPGIVHSWYKLPNISTVVDSDSLLNGASGGTYMIIDTNYAGCKDTAFVTIEEPNQPLSISYNVVDPIKCFGDTIGKVSVKVAGGTGALTHKWVATHPVIHADAADSSFATNLRANVLYSDTVRDANGCTTDTFFTLTEPNPITFGASVVTPVKCKGENTGQVVVVASGGSGVYTSYTWTGTGSGTSTRTGLFAGSVSVTVRDSKGCERDTTFTISEPANALVGTVTIDNQVLCKGQSTGKAHVTTTGGTPNYTYTWSRGTATGTNNDTATGLSVGSISAFIVDAQGCRDTAINTITEPATGIVANMVVSEQVKCKGESTAIAYGFATGGTPNFSFSWDRGTPTSGTGDTVKSVSGGSLRVIITDAQGCKDTATQTITEPAAILAGTVTVDANVLCKGESTGKAHVTTTGGTTNYTYTWSRGTAIGTNNDTATGLSVGSISAFIVDANGCKDTATNTISEPANALTGVLTIDSNILCKGESTGKVHVTTTGGTPNYTYTWSRGTITGTNNDTARGLSAGSISAFIVDAQGCKDTATTTVVEPATGLVGTVTIDNQVLCKGQSTGKAHVTTTGGTPNYTYTWSRGTAKGTNNDTATGLSVGSISAFIVDAQGCRDTAINTITEPATGVSVTLGNKVNPTCVGSGNNGSIKAFATGGIPAYKYKWNTTNPNDTLDTLGGQPARIVFVTVTDANGCTSTAFDTLFSPGNITVRIDTIRGPRCKGFTNGVLQAVKTGGIGPFGYVWTAKGGNVRAGSGGTIWENTGADTITVMFIDSSNMCNVSATSILVEPDTLLANPIMLTAVSCKNGSNGTAKAIPTGGTNPYKYLWNTTNPNDTLDTIAGLSAGFIKVTVTDDSLCTHIDSVEITQPATGVVGTINLVDSVKCKGLNTAKVFATATGGTAPIGNYTWSGPSTTTISLTGSLNDTASGLSADTIYLRTTNTVGCTHDTFRIIGEPTDTVSVTLGTKVNPNCVGIGNNGSIVATPLGGTPGYKYTWVGSGSSNAPNDPVRTGMTAGIIFVTVSDTNECIATAFDTLFSPGNITVTLDTVQDILCNGFTNGVMRAVKNGGTGPFGYVWTAKVGNKRAGIDSIWENTGADTISVELIDSSNNCRTNASAILVEPDSVSISIVEVVPISCAGDSANLRAVVTGGTRPYNYNWRGVGISGGFDSLRNKVHAGNHSIIVKDVNLCLDTIQSYSVTAPNALAGLITTDTVTCFGDSGIASVVVTGGKLPYQYQWSHGTGGLLDDTSKGIRSGLFSLTITDDGGAGCSLILTDTIHSPDSLYGVFVDINPPGCGGTSLGSIRVEPKGGTPGYPTYTWSAGTIGSADSIRVNIPVGLLSVLIEDSKGCVSDSIKINMAAPGNTNPNFSTIKNPDCVGDSTGQLIVKTNGGTPGYTYDWFPTNLGVKTDSLLDSLPAGVLITVVVTDNNGTGCKDTISTTLTPPTAFSLNFLGEDPKCAGSADGKITVTPVGGTPGYTYSWNTGVTTQVGNPNIAINLSGGTFIPVTVTDDNGTGCSVIDSFRLTEPTALTLSFIDSVSLNCNGDDTGKLVALATGGSGLINYTWTSSASITTETFIGSTASNLKGGIIYTVTAIAGVCSTSVSKSLLEPTAITLSAFPPFAGGTSCGDNNGILRAFPTGGKPRSTGFPPPSRYDYAWDSAGVSKGGNTFFLNNLYAGAYNVTVSDTLGCSATFIGTVSDRGAPVIRVDSVIDATCEGVCDGGIYTSEVLIFNPPIASYKWLNSSGTTVGTSPDLIAQCTGNYTLQVTDDSGCVRVLNRFIDNDTALTLSFTPKGLSCNSTACDGELTVIPKGGQLTYSYQWSTSPTDILPKVTNLCANQYYKVTVSDSRGCSAIDSSILLPPSNITAIFSSSDTICNGASNGFARIDSVKGGNTPYSYLWDSGIPDTFSIKNGLIAGTYTVTVKEAGGCDKVDTVVVIQRDPITATFVIQDANCATSDGKATATPSGGAGYGYQYQWPGSTGFTSLSSDSGYAATITNVLIRDGVGCQASIPFTIGNINGPVLTFDSIHHETCYKECDGGIFVSLSGGNPAYNYEWKSSLGLPVSTNQDLDTSCAGEFTLTITDQKNCLAFYTDTIDSASAIKSNIQVVSKITQVGFCDGIAAVNPSGGVGPYNVVWTDRNSSTTDTINALCDSLYYVTITDAKGCQIIDSIEVRDPLVIVLDSVHLNEPTCGSNPCDGKAKIFVSGGLGSYTYTWGNSDKTDSTVNRCAGVLMVTVTDGIVSSVFQIPLSNANASVIGVDSANVSCKGSSDGSAWGFLISGDPISGWNWPGLSITTDTAKNLSAGLYSIEATNNRGCISADTIRVNEPTDVSATFVKTEPNCGMSDGQLIAIGAGGNGGYSYSWLNATKGALSPPQNIDTAKNIPSGIYFVRVLDAKSCSTDVQVTLNDKNSAVITRDSVLATSCVGTCDGGLFVSTSGGTGLLSYKWDKTNSIGLDTIQDLDTACAGVYTLVVTDGLGCKSRFTDTVKTIDTLKTTVLVINNASAQSICDGAASVSVSGAKKPITYNWSNLNTTNLSTALCAGTHYVTVTDDKGCMAIDSALITEPITIKIIKIDSVNPVCGKCDGKMKITVAGGKAPYTYKWDNNDTADSTTNRCAGLILVTVTDANLDSNTFILGLGNLNGPTLATTSTDATCFGSCNGTLGASATGGTPGYSFDWPTLGKFNTPTVSNVCAGNYLVQVTDKKGCITIGSDSVAEPKEIIAVADTNMANCAKSDGSVNLTVAGGIGALTYKWSNNTTTSAPTLGNLSAGVYSVTIEDTKPCSTVVNFNIINSNGPAVVVDNIINETCPSSNDGAIYITATGKSPFQYLWTPGNATIEDTIGVAAGTYTVKVTDKDQCVTIIVDTVKAPIGPTSNVAILNHASSYGRCDAKAYVSVNNPVGMNYNWSNGEIGDTARKLCAGFNYVTITTPAGCKYVDTVLIVQPNKLIINSFSMVNPLCNVCNGEIRVFVTGGTPPYTYAWDNGDKADSTLNRCAGLVTLTVIDSRNYSEKFSFTLNNTIKPGVSVSGENVVCFGSCNGSAKAIGSGISAPYTYNWPTLGVKKDTVSGLCAGTYFVEVKDKIGCLAVDSVTILEPTALGANFIVNQPVCGGSNPNPYGNIIVSGYGGIPNSSGYSYTWLTKEKIEIGGTPPFKDTLVGTAGLYHVIIKDSIGCFDTLQVSMNEAGGVSLAINSVRTISCENGCDGFISAKAIAVSGTVSFVWFPTIEASKIISTDSTSIANGLCAGEYTVEATNDKGCKTTGSVKLINPEGFNVVMRNIVDATCKNTNDGSIETLIERNGIYTYKWFGPDSFDVNSPRASNIVAGEYRVTATDEFGCSDSTKDSVRVEVGYTIQAFGDTSYCGLPNNHLVYVATNNKASYVTTWYDGTGNILGKLDTLRTGLKIGTNLIISEVRESICVEYDTVKVEVQEVFTVDAGKDRTIVNGQTTTLGGNPSAPDNTKIVWVPIQGLSAVNVQNPTVSPSESTTYKLLVSSDIGCAAEDTVRVIVDDRLRVNNGFSPNGDGSNDVWELALLRDFPNASVKIYNRWGQLLYASEPYIPWDGTFRGQPMAIGTYYYVIDLKAVHLENSIITGPLTIVR